MEFFKWSLRFIYFSITQFTLVNKNNKKFTVTQYSTESLMKHGPV